MEMAVVDSEERFRIEVERFRKSLGRSGVVVRLFDFLVERSSDDRIPKEIEVAQEVFDRSIDFETSQDASVRVYIHRLRRKLDQFYAGTTGPRLLIPLGEYRISLANVHADAVPFEEIEPLLVEEPEPDPVPPQRRRRWLWWGAGLFLLLNAAALLLIFASRPGDPNRALMDTVLWKPLAASNRLTFVVVGDYYIFGEAPDETEVRRLVREFSINSREDLDQYLMVHPEDAGRFVDVGLHYLPTGAAAALGDILPVVNAAAAGAAGRTRVITTSALTPYILKGANVVYIGFFSGLNVLRDPLFQASGFEVGGSYDELIDRATGKHYMSDASEVLDNHVPHRDYGYLASIPGPSGNRVLIVSGTRDAAVMQAAEVATDKAQLDLLAKKTGGDGPFEALYEVRTIGNLNVGARLVVARPLQTTGMWRSDHPIQVFPDQQPANDLLGSARKIPGKRS